MRAEPVKDRIVVVREEGKEVTKGGIVIPKTAMERPEIGVVNASGPDSNFKPGDRLLFGMYAGTEFELDGITLLLLRDDEVLAKLVE